MFLLNSIFFSFCLNFLALGLGAIWAELSNNGNRINDHGHYLLNTCL